MNDLDVKVQDIKDQTKIRLSEFFSDCFTLISQLRITNNFGAYDVFRQRIGDLLSKVEKKAKAAGFDFEDIHKALFAVIAFIDETVIVSEWEHKQLWLSKPLQLEYFNRYDAGVEFFIHLDQLSQNPKQNWMLLEIYFLCMTLGFKGKYQVEGKEKLRKIIDNTFTELQQFSEADFNQISPHGQRKDEIINVVTKEMPMWIIGVFVLTIGFFFYLIATLLISKESNDLIQFLNQIV
jgi:type VI secretion system protein ImpK